MCNGFCSVCPNPCYRGEIRGKQRELEGIPSNLERKLSDVFDNAEVSVPQSSEKGLAVVENAGTYEVRKSVFGKEKVRKLK